MPLEKTELRKLQEFLRHSFGNESLRVALNPKNVEAADVHFGERPDTGKLRELVALAGGDALARQHPHATRGGGQGLALDLFRNGVRHASRQ